jgi:hypothetical protein
MQYQFLVDRKIKVASPKQIILPITIMLASMTLAILSQYRLFAGHLMIFLGGGFIMLGLAYLLQFIILFPMLAIIILVRSKGNKDRLLTKSALIILSALSTSALVWAGMSIVSLTMTVIPWSIFSVANSWMVALLLPLSLFYFYWRFTDCSVTDSLLDSMILSGMALILPLLHL